MLRLVQAASLSLLTLCPFILSAAEAYMFSVLAGSRVETYRDGPGRTAAFASPAGFARDGEGNLYIADTNNSCIRKLTPTGVVSTYGGSPGWQELVDGPLSSARFRGPTALAFDPSGNLIVADRGAVRMISPAGIVSTLTEAAQPTGIAIGPDGTIYLAEGGFAAIRRLGRDGTLTPFAGAYGVQGDVDGPALQARFKWVNDLAIDAAGNIYVADGNNQSVRRISAAGMVTTLQRNVFATGVAVDRANNVIVAESGYALWKINPAGTVTRLLGGIGGYIDGDLSRAQIQSPHRVFFDRGDNLYFSDGQLIRRLSPDGMVTTLAGQPGGANAGDADASTVRFFGPGGAALDSRGNLYVTETGSHIVRRIDASGAATVFAGTPGHAGGVDGSRATALFNSPHAITVASDDSLYLCDLNGIRKIDRSGSVSTFPIGYGINDARGILVAGFAFDSAGNTWFADSGNGVIARISHSDTLEIVAGAVGQLGFIDGPVAAARFGTLAGIAVGPEGAIYVLDAGNSAVRVISPSGTVSSRAVALPFERIGLGTGFSDPLPTGILVEPDRDIVVMSQRVLHRLGPGGEWRPVIGAGPPMGEPKVSSIATSGLTSLSATRDGSWLMIDPWNGTVLRAALRPPSQLVNLSTRAHTGSDADTLIAGFTVAGAGARPAVIRGLGPSLAQFGIPDAVANPRLRLHNTRGGVQENDDWGGTAGAAAAFAGVGAFGLPAMSRDAALLTDLTPGGYTAHVVGSPSGSAMVEVYAAGPVDSARLTNLSSRAVVGPAAAMFAGFTIRGEARKALVLRGIGPGLAPLGVSGALNNVRLTLVDSVGRTIATNVGWGGVARFAEAFSRVGAFPLGPPHGDAALLVDLEPGSYTLLLSSAFGGSGVAMVEIYDADL